MKRNMGISYSTGVTQTRLSLKARQNQASSTLQKQNIEKYIILFFIIKRCY